MVSRFFPVFIFTLVLQRQRFCSERKSFTPGPVEFAKKEFWFYKRNLLRARFLYVLVPDSSFTSMESHHSFQTPEDMKSTLAAGFVVLCVFFCKPLLFSTIDYAGLWITLQITLAEGALTKWRPGCIGLLEVSVHFAVVTLYPYELSHEMSPRIGSQWVALSFLQRLFKVNCCSAETE